MRIAAGLMTLVLLGAGAAHAQSPPAVWVEITAAGPEARAVTDAAACPSIVVDGKPRPMTQRAAPNDAFPNQVCAAAIPKTARKVTLDGAVLPLPKARPNRLVIIGDSGCRVAGNFVQNCNDPVAGWPFARVAALAAAAKPDLVIHVGDYYYRETPCPTGVAACAGTTYGDKWPTWVTEVFAPAAPLLAAAPWVVARGNHEDCNRGGKGWFRLLDAAPQVNTCPAQSETFAVDLGGTRLFIVDSADPNDAVLNPAQQAVFAAHLDDMAKDHGKGPAWIVTHRPIWIVSRNGAALSDGIGNVTERAAVKGRDLAGVQLVLVGHVHNFTSLDFGPTRPAELIVGAGGDLQDPRDLPTPAVGPVTVDGLQAQAYTRGGFGYFVFDRKGADWVGAFHDLDDKVVTTCRLHARSLTCAQPKP